MPENKKYSKKYDTRQQDIDPNSLTETSLRVPPHNIDAERALLGSLLLNGTLLIDIVDTTPVECFYADKHRLIYAAMCELYALRTPIDVITVSGKLREQAFLDIIGGLPYLSDLSSRTPASSNIVYYADIVVNKYTLRALIGAGYTIGELGFNESDAVESIIDQSEQKLFAVTQQTKRNNFTLLRDFLPGTWDQMERLMEHKDELRGVPTGFVGLDKKLSGLQNSDLVILAARPSVGKTSLALDIARNAATNGCATAIFSLEMSSDQLTQRMLSAESRVDLWKIRTSKGLTTDDLEAIKDGMSRLSTIPLYIDDTAGMTILGMRSAARRLKIQYNLRLIVVDYLQLITPSRNYDNVVTQISDISRALKEIARELQVPVVALSQLSRAVEARGGKPKLSDLRDSGAIEQDADVVMFIHREANEEGGGRQMHTELLIEKHRNGPTGVVSLYFDADKATFLEMEQNDFGGFN
jgi:replicative DNA helicase